MENTFGKPVEVEVRDSLEKAMKILKQKMSKEGILQEVKRRRFYEKPSVKKKRKIREARKRRRREAKRRGANILAEVVGYGMSADAFHLTSPPDDGEGAYRVMRNALQDAKLDPTQIDYINAHGTSTKVNDQVETLACKQALGNDAYRTPVSSIKSMMGHLIAAAGAVELITCLLSIQRGALPPTINYETKDPDCDLDYIPNQPRETRKVKRCLSNSFGFGGQNISLIVSEFAA